MWLEDIAAGYTKWDGFGVLGDSFADLANKG